MINQSYTSDGIEKLCARICTGLCPFPCARRAHVLYSHVLSKTYEFIVRCKPLVAVHTDVYVNNGRICYTEQASFTPPELDTNFINNGVLRVYRPDQHYWVYQYEGSLYWVVDNQFHFNPSGSTYIQYQLWTTQINKLPQHRLENGWYWDNNTVTKTISAYSAKRQKKKV